MGHEQRAFQLCLCANFFFPVTIVGYFAAILTKYFSCL